MDKKNKGIVTYHWRHPIHIDERDYLELVEFVKLLLKTSDIPIVGGLGENQTKAIIDSTVICFNGKSPNDGETFFLPRFSDDLGFIKSDGLGNYYRMCDTYGKPYDALVIATLKAAEYIGVIDEWYCDDYEEDHSEGLQLFAVVKNYFIIKREQRRKYGLPN